MKRPDATGPAEADPQPPSPGDELVRVLVLSYFFPPCNLAAAQRAQSWATYLSTYGYKPVVVTRKWDEPLSRQSDVSRPTSEGIRHEVFESHEVFYLPYRGNLRDRIYVRHPESRFALFRRALTFLELVMQPFFEAAIPHRNMRRFALDYLRRHPDITRMVVTGNPFNLFRFAFTLHRATGIGWIADYRDAWTTSTINLISKGVLHRLVNRLERYFERRWVGTARFVTASSQPIADAITALVEKESLALHNGFVAEDFEGLENAGKFEDFTVSYVGTLYDGQRIELFCEAFKRLVDANPSARVKLLFLGLAFYKEQQERIARALKGYEGRYECTGRMERRRILTMEKQSHLLLHVAWDQHDGIIASKIYEYIASGTFILVAPTDEGSIQDIVEQSRCGVCTKTVDETLEFLEHEYQRFLAGEWRRNDLRSEHALQYSRLRQTGRLAALLDRL